MNGELSYFDTAFPINIERLVASLVTDEDFKALCDVAVRMEVGPLGQLFDRRGADGGADAEFNGAYGGITGRWVFQYKFTHPGRGLSIRTRELKRAFLGGDSEFDKVRVSGCAGYILITNLSVNPKFVAELRERWDRQHNGIPFCVWDIARWRVLAMQHPQVLYPPSLVMCETVATEIAFPLNKASHDIVRTLRAGSEPNWPISVTLTEVNRPPVEDPVLWGDPTASGKEYVPTYASKVVVADLVGRVQQVAAHPLWAFGLHRAFPRAFKHVAELLTSLEQLAKSAEAYVRDVMAMVLADESLSRTSTNDRNPALAMLIANGLIRGSARGYRPFTVQCGELMVENVKTWAVTGEAIGALRQLQSQVKAAGVPEQLASLTERTCSIAEVVAGRTYYPARLKIDAPEATSP